MPEKTPKILNIFLVRFLPLAFICIMLAIMVYSIEHETNLHILKSREESHVTSSIRDINRIGNRISSDIRFLSSTAPLINYLNQGQKEDFDEIVQDFSAFSQAKKVYDQIRFIDTNGQEIIRVDYRPDGPVVIPREKLQNKADRYYFSEAITLSKGEIYVSPLDLNVEHNAIEIPYKPMLRASTPVFDRQNRLRGIIVLNYYAAELISRVIDNDKPKGDNHLSLLNSDGYWLRSPDPALEWGFMFNRPELTMAKMTPEAWKVVKEKPKGQFKDRHGLWTFEKTYLLAGIPEIAPAESDYHWIVISFIPNSVLEEERYNLLSSVGFLLLLALLFVAFGVWSISTARINQKRAEIAALYRLDQLQLLMDSTLEGIYGVDLAGYCIMANRSCAKMLGFDKPSELIGKQMHQMVHHSHPDGTPYPVSECRAHRAIETGTESTVDDEVFWCKDGTPLPVAYTSRPIIDNEKIVGMVCTFVDISERLKEQQERLRLLTVLEESLNEIYLFDTKTLKFEFVNRAALQNLGYSMDEMRDLTAYDIKPLISEHEFKRIINPLLEGNQQTIEIQTVHERKDGTTYPVDVHLQLIWSNNNASFLAIIFDISERIAMENQLRHAQKMEAIGQLASGIAHDFNNIMQVISGNAQLIKMKSAGDKQTEEHVSQIIKSVDRGVSLTKSMLAFARRQNLSLSPIELNRLVHESELLAQKLLDGRHRLIVELYLEPLRISADATLLQQVLFNLITNARDAMPDGGNIQIKTGRCDLSIEFIEQHGFGCVGPYATLQVIDSGHGIDEGIRAKIFDPFFTTKDIGKGTGLGLAMIYGTVKQHHGYILLESEPGNGASFTIFLPLLDSDPLNSASDKPLDEYRNLMGKGETILVVEDSEITRKQLTAFLNRCGYEVLSAPSGREALDIFREAKRIDLAVLDIVMAGLDGVETLEIMRQKRPDLPALYLSAHGSDLLRLRGVESKCIMKPIDLKELLTELRHLLQD